MDCCSDGYGLLCLAVPVWAWALAPSLRLARIGGSPTAWVLEWSCIISRHYWVVNLLVQLCAWVARVVAGFVHIGGPSIPYNLAWKGCFGVKVQLGLGLASLVLAVLPLNGIRSGRAAAAQVAPA